MNNADSYSMMGYLAAYIIKDYSSAQTMGRICLDMLNVKNKYDIFISTMPEYKWMVLDDNLRDLFFDAAGNRIK